MRHLLALLTALALLASACADDAQEVGEDTGAGADAVEVGSDDGPAPAGRDADVETVTAGAAGEVDVRIIDDRRLELVEVREAAGWTHTIDALDDGEIELDFHHADGQILELEIELEDGRLQVSSG